MSIRAVIMICAAKEDGPYIREFVHYHKILGFDHCYIYDNGEETEESIARSLTPQDLEFCTVVRQPGKSTPERNVQREMYQAFVKSGREQDWVAFIDVDEFIVPMRHDNIKEFLEEYGGLGSIGVNWRMFGPCGRKTKPEGLVVENYTLSMPNPCIKTLCKIQDIDNVHNAHNVSGKCRALDGKLIDGFRSYANDETEPNRHTATIRVNHYYTRSLQELKEKVARGRLGGAQAREVDDCLLPFTSLQFHDSHLIDKYLPRLKASLQADPSQATPPGLEIRPGLG